MLSIAVYSDCNEDTISIKSIIQDFLIEYKIMAKVSVFTNAEDLIIIPNRYDIYIMDMDSKEDAIVLGKQMMDIDAGSHFIYLSYGTSMAYKATKIHADYFLEKPISVEEFKEILHEIRQEIKEDNIIIPIPGGERRVRVNNLNYINIVKRCLCYHLKDGTMFDGQTLRTSFEKAISPLQYHKTKAFYFLAPSLLINIGEVKIINGDNLIFENDDVLYFPKKSYEMIRKAWLDYNSFISDN